MLLGTVLTWLSFASCGAPRTLFEHEVLEESNLYLDTSSAPPGVLETRLGAQMLPGETLDTEIALAYGLSERSELSASWNPHGYDSQRGPDPRHASFLSTQWLTRFNEESETRASLALALQVMLPLSDGDQPEQASRARLGLLATKTTGLGVLTGELGLDAALESVTPETERSFEVLAALHAATYLGHGFGCFSSLVTTSDVRIESDSALLSAGLAYGTASNWTADVGLRRGYGAAATERELFWELTIYF